MFEFSHRLGNILIRGGRKNRLAIVTVLFVILSPVLLLAAFSYLRTRQDLTSSALSQRRDIAYLAATTVKEKLDRLADLSVALASRVRFRQLVGEGKWDEAVQIMSSVPKDFPFIDRSFLSNLDGTLMADSPALPDVRGKNFASRDWYRGVSRDWKPYISEVYQRAAEPRYNVVAAAVPIKAPNGTTAGILVLQVKLDSLLEWTKNIQTGPGGFVFVVDKTGKIAAHPKHAPQDEIVDYTQDLVVQKLLRGAQGIETLFNPQERESQIVAYQPVPEYGWGVIVQQSAVTAFAERDRNLERILAAYGFILLLNFGLAYLILTTIIKLKQGEEVSSRLASIVEFSDDAIIGTTLDGTVSTWNAGAEKIYGYSAEEVEGRSISLLVPRENRSEMRNILDKIWRGQLVNHYETARVKKDGTKIDVSLTVSPIKDPSGKIIGASAIERDISDRKNAEQSFRALVESAPDAMVIAEKGGRIILVNAQAEKLFGYSQKELIGEPVELLLPERFRGNHVKSREGYFANPHTRPMGAGLELFARRKDGTEVPVEISLGPISTDRGLLVTASIRDITERKQAETLVRDARAFAESVVDTVKQPLLVLDKDLRIRSANRAFYQNFKTTTEEIEGQPFFELGNAVWNVPRLRGLLEQVLSRGTQLDDFDVDSHFPGIGRKVMRLNARYLYREGNNTHMILLAFEDITAQTEYEHELRKKNEQLEKQNQLVQEANRLKSEFLANMSHELRTPLNAIIGFSQLMHDGKVGPVSADHKEYLGDILTSARHLLQLINDVLDLSKIEAGRLEFNPETVRLAALMSEVQHILQTLMVSKRLTVEVEVAPSLEEIFIDPAKLKQILYNYLSNAIKFTPQDGRIAIRALPENSDFFRLEVEDTGIGIKSDNINKLFTQFQQLRTDGGGKPQGTGLGLALTKKIVEAQGGHVGVQSIFGKGSVFYAVLPKVIGRKREVTKQESDAGSESSVVATSGAAKVLIIEDSERDRMWLTKILSEAGYSVDTAGTGAEGIAKAESLAYSAILLDLIFPDMIGWDVLHAIRSRGPNQQVPVIAVTLAGEKGIAMGVPVQDHLAKPVSPATLVDSLKRAGVQPNGPKKTILVVDDDPKILKVARAALKSAGYQVVCRGNGTTALAAAGKSEFAAVILDLLMPEMDGFEFVERLRQISGCRNTPVIVWTNKDVTPEDKERLTRSTQFIALKGQDGIEAVLEELKRHSSRTVTDTSLSDEISLELHDNEP